MSNVIPLRPRKKAPSSLGIKRCSVGSKPSPWSTYLDWNWYHSWPKGQRATGRCFNCRCTLQELTIKTAKVFQFKAKQ